LTSPVLTAGPDLEVARPHAFRPRRHRRPRWRGRRWLLRATVLVLIVLLLPVPWRHHVSDDPPGLAWRLNGRLHVEGRAIDPPGRWSWLTVGRPPLVGEVAWRRVRGAPLARDLRDGPEASHPQVSDPIAVAVGRNAAGAALPLTVLVEATGATYEGLPDPAVLTRLNGVDLVDRRSYERARQRPRTSTWFWTTEGSIHGSHGLELPYLRVSVSDVAPPELDARIGSDHPTLRWLRSLAVGSSHGLIVALMSYADAAEVDLARGRHIAGTGRMFGDGSVGRIGGLPAKAAAARRAGADVLVFPSSQAVELARFDPGEMELVGVANLADAIAALTEGTGSLQAAP
jgi:hypothetical protein